MLQISSVDSNVFINNSRKDNLNLYKEDLESQNKCKNTIQVTVKRIERNP